jgi:hypothetical protein
MTVALAEGDPVVTVEQTARIEVRNLEFRFDERLVARESRIVRRRASASD